MLLLTIFIINSFAYKYNLSQFSGYPVCNQDNSSCSPRFYDGFKGVGTGVLKLRQGVMILSGTAISTDDGDIDLQTDGTYCFTVFIFNVNQMSTLYASTSTNSYNSYLNLMINNGKMRIECGNYSNNAYSASPTKETSSSSMYTTGWNLLCYTTSSTNFNFYSNPRFSTSVLNEGTSNSIFRNNNYSGVFGGKIDNQHSSFSNSFQGIVHAINIQNTAYLPSSIVSSFLVPTSSPYVVCDYFIGMFTNLGVQDASSAFTNVMYNHYSQTQQFTNSLSSTVDTTNGLSFSSGQTQTITSVKVTDQRAIGVQFWVKGSFTNNNQIASIAKSSTSKGAYVARNANDILVKTTYSSATVTFPNAIPGLNSANWIFIGFSVGWMGTNNDFMICGYIYQSSTSYEAGDCASPTTISSTDFGSGVTLYVELGSGITGSIKEVYVTNHMEHFHVFAYFKNTLGDTRYDCYEQFNYDPHYIRQGCGNGHTLLSESTEQCDDGNTVSSDGCSSTCQIEDLYKCVDTIGLSPISVCTYTCGNSNYESQYTEGCDDGNTSGNDGCSSNCSAEIGWTCTNVAGSKSTCSAICGDGKVLGTEVCDDGNASDNIGCKSDCTGSINGYHCSGGSSSTASICLEQCNDGYITLSEQCEDGNTSNNDGCSSTCQIETGWTCTNNAAMTSSTCTPICGDGKKVGSEVCDDGNASDNIGCKSDCTGSINGYHCSGGSSTTASTCTQQCNDGYITPSEQCEDGNTNSNDGCSSTCQIEIGWTCTNNAAMTLSTCTPICGDGKKVGSEACDDGNILDNKGCKSDCSGSINGWHCSGGSSTTSDVCNEQCGDKYVTIDEQCDDGNTNNDDGCSSICFVETGWTCSNTNSTFTNQSICTSICGDGKRYGNEKCDDGKILDTFVLVRIISL